LPDISKAIFKLQVTADTYKEVTVIGLQHQNTIYQGHSVNTDLDDVIADADNMNFIVPVHYGVASGMNRIIQNQLYQESLVLVLNSYQITEVKWYQTAFFKLIIIVIVIIIMWYTGYFADWAITLAGIAAEGITMALVYSIVIKLLVGFAIGYAMELIAKAVGPELAAIISIVVAIVSIVYGDAWDTVSFLGTEMVTAEVLLSSSVALMTAASGEITKEIEDISAQYEEFLLTNEARWEELEASRELLESTNLLSFDLLETQTNKYLQHPITDPDKFYDLTIHIGNIGTKVLDIIPNFYDIALKLPNTDRTSFTNNMV
jgi:hypothetical protein